MFKLFKDKYEKYYDSLIKETKQDKLKEYGYNPKYANQDNILFDLYGSCDEFNKSIKLIIIADTHGCLKENELVTLLEEHPEYDLCLLLGDHSINDVRTVLKYIDESKIYCLLGNHDGNYIDELNLQNLNGRVITINHVKMLGIEGSYRYKNENFPSFSQRDSLIFLNDKEKVDILVSHDSPFKLSERNDSAHQGLFGITYYLYKNKIPYCIHGHLHTPYEKVLKNGTKVNCYYMLNYVEIK